MLVRAVGPTLASFGVSGVLADPRLSLVTSSQATLAINGRICEDYPRIAEESLKSGWDFMGHSYDQRPIHLEPNQGKTIRRTVKILSKFSGKAVLGLALTGLARHYGLLVAARPQGRGESWRMPGSRPRIQALEEA